MIEIVVKDNELQIYIDRKKLAEWLAGTGDVPWDGDPNSEGDSTDDKGNSRSSTDASEPQGFKTADGEKKEFPAPAGQSAEEEQDTTEDTTEDGGEVEGVNLFDEGPTGIGGILQKADKGKDKIKQLRDWMKEEKFNYRNFCLFLHQIEELAGFKLSVPLIGVTAKKEPTIFQVATRFYTYWLGAKDDVADAYKAFLRKQLEDMGITIQMVKDEFNGEEIDPRNLPKALAVTK